MERASDELRVWNRKKKRKLKRKQRRAKRRAEEERKY